MNSSYGDEFYKLIEQGVQNSAKVIVPLLIDQFKPNSVIDIGCGTGAWLNHFRKHGVSNIFGIDGQWIDQEQLVIAPNEFAAMDLNRPMDLSALPYSRFDMALCLEVGEHLPPASSELLVKNLTEISSVVVFSAAIPGQGGVSHINEQWQSYWAQLFEQHNFVTIDWLRPIIWDDRDVDTWYKQNTIIFINKDALNKWPDLGKIYANYPRPITNIVHPSNYMQKYKDTDPSHMSFINTIKKLPQILISAIKRKI